MQDSSSFSKNAIISLLAWFCITLFYCYQYILRVIPNIIMPDLMSNFGIGAAEFGSFAGIYYIGYIAIHIPVGVLLARLGARMVLSACILLTSFGLAPVIYSDSWTLVLLGRLLTGIGSSAAIVGALQIFRIIYPDSFTRMLGIMVSFGLITVVYAGGPLAEFIIYFGLEAAVNIILYSGIGLAVATFLLMPKSADLESSGSIMGDILAVLGNPKIIICSLLAGFMVGPAEGFADAWGSAYLVQVYEFAKIDADNTVLSIFLGMCFGCVIMPFIADKFKAHYGVTIFSGSVMAACFVYVLSMSAQVNQIYYICMLVGVFCSYQVIIISKISTFVSEEKSGMAASVANMVIMTFGWVFHNSIGFLLERNWDGQVVDGVKKYSTSAFNESLSIIPVAIVVAIIGIFILSMVDRKK